jgi:C-terminal processing protease CtpA/Prc
MLTRALFLSSFLAISAAGQNVPPHPVAIFERIYQALRDNYPMAELAGWRGEEWFQEFKAKIDAAPTREEAFGLMDEFVCRLNDYHTQLYWPEKPRTAGPPARAEPVLSAGSLPAGYGIWGRLHPPLELPALEGVAIAVVQAAENSGLRPGDEIVSVDGVPVREALARAWRHAVGSSVGGKLHSAALRMLLGNPDSGLRLQIRRSSAKREATVVVARSNAPCEETISHREVGGVPVIRIARWEGDNLLAAFDGMIEEVRNRPGIIIDVRGNGGGSDQLASDVTARFLAAPVFSSISFHRIVPGTAFQRTVETTAPRGPWRYEGRVAVLTDEGCMSACEHFVSGMIEGGALACGTPTSGACGWIRPVDLPGGVQLHVSRTFPLHTGGIPSPQLGIAPHIWAPPSLKDLRHSKDTALGAALLWIKSKNPLPVRLQPVWPLSR